MARKKLFKAPSDVVPQTPSIVMADPRYPHNVGAAIRAASCYDVTQVWLTGRRVVDLVLDSKRIPREERMKGFESVDIVLDPKGRPFDYFGKGVTPVAVELLEGSENLIGFEHPENPIYVFGPEDGSIPKSWRPRCHRRIFLPTRHCTNLAAAVYTVLYDRKYKRVLAGKERLETMRECLYEDRGQHMGWPSDDNPVFQAVT